MDSPPPRTIPYDQPIAVADPNGTRALALGPQLRIATRLFNETRADYVAAIRRGRPETMLRHRRRVLENAENRRTYVTGQFQEALIRVRRTDPVLASRVEALVEQTCGG